MAIHYVIQALLVIVGTVTVVAAIFNQDWFFESKNAEPVVKFAGRRKSRIIYGIIGLLFIVLALYSFFHIRATII